MSAGQGRPWVVLSGATSGIGLATTRLLVARGFRVAGLGRRADALASVLDELGPSFTPVQVDLAESESVRNCCERLLVLCANVAGLVNNAAECVYCSALQMEPSAWERLFSINVYAPMALARALAPRLSEGAAIVQLSSVTARHLPGPKFAPYASTKAAMDTLMEGLRLELFARNVRVCSIAPGLVDTPIYGKFEGFERARQNLIEQIPQWLRPEDVAEAVLWILERPAQVAVADVVITPTRQPR